MKKEKIIDYKGFPIEIHTEGRLSKNEKFEYKEKYQCWYFINNYNLDGEENHLFDSYEEIVEFIEENFIRQNISFREAKFYHNFRFNVAYLSIFVICAIYFVLKIFVK